MVKKKVKLLPPIQPSVALIREYQKALKPLITRMAHSVEYWIKNPFEAATDLQEPDVPEADGVMDASPAARMEARLKKIKNTYQKEFNHLAPKIAKSIANKTQQNVSRRLRSQLKDIMTVDVAATRRVNNVMMEYRAQNLSYIRNIPQRYFVKVEGEIMRAAAQGRDMAALTESLKSTYKLTLNQAYFLAQDQVKKATEAIERTAKQDIGLYTDIWRHSAISAEPRISHKHADGKEYDNRKGCKIDGEYIFPKQLPGCNCYSQTKIEY